MILRESLIEIGTVIKPHGVNGEMSVSTEFDIDFNELKCIVLEMDGIFVPFFIDTVRPRGASAVLLKLDGVESDRDALKFSRKAVYALRSDVDIEDAADGDGFYAEDMIDFTVNDIDAGLIGTITGVNDATDNVLFIVTRPDGSEVFIPVVDEMIIELDPEAKTCLMNLPEGLLQLN